MSAHDDIESDERRMDADAITAHDSTDDIRPRTRLGAQLLERRRAIIAAGIPLLSWDELEAEIAERRGERS
ncbi:MAG TPA: hypothetical protein VHA53_01955 [Nitrolancea sp.]|nr:hypothetical protein [Nitrolancea sp.]